MNLLRLRHIRRNYNNHNLILLRPRGHLSRLFVLGTRGARHTPSPGPFGSFRVYNHPVPLPLSPLPPDNKQENPQESRQPKVDGHHDGSVGTGVLGRPEGL